MKRQLWTTAAVGLALWLAALPEPAAAEQAPAELMAFEGGPADLEPARVAGEQVPVAHRAVMLLDALASLEREPERAADGVLLAAGLDPASPAGRRLVGLAVDFAERMPARIPEESLQRFTASGDDAGFLAFQRQRNLERSEAAGVALGTWLRERSDEGYAAGPLADRLLRGGLLRIEIRSDGGAADLHLALDERAARFEQGLASELSTLPKALRRTESDR